MSTHDQTSSYLAVRDCMDSIGLRDRTVPSHQAEANFRMPGMNLFLGNIDISFDVRDPSEGPELNCDADIIKGFGIPHSNFRTRFQTFLFNPIEKELRITGDGYDFILSFAHL